MPEPDKDLREVYEKNKALLDSTKIFLDPDTSVCGIKIRNVKSALEVLGSKTKLQGDSTHIFYSLDKKQTLALTVHAGECYSQVSIFKVSYSTKTNATNRILNYKIFQTEKGIQLGITKKELIKKLGNSFLSNNNDEKEDFLVYRIEMPFDSRTKLLESNNMPIYYASYKFDNNKLQEFEFGFEYP